MTWFPIVSAPHVPEVGRVLWQTAQVAAPENGDNAWIWVAGAMAVAIAAMAVVIIRWADGWQTTAKTATTNLSENNTSMGKITTVTENQQRTMEQLARDVGELKIAIAAVVQAGPTLTAAITAVTKEVSELRSDLGLDEPVSRSRSGRGGQ